MKLSENFFPATPEQSSQSRSWEGGSVQVYQLEPSEAPVTFPGFPAFQVLCLLDGETRARIKCGGQNVYEGSFRSGELVISSAALTGAPREFMWDRPVSVASALINVKLLAEVAKHIGIDATRVVMTDHFGVRDALIEQIVRELARELEADDGRSRVHAEELLHALSVHLLRRYCTVEISESADGQGGLPKGRLRLIENYVHTHLGQGIELADLAEEANMSAYHFSRLFKKSMGTAPYQFVIEKRMEEAKRLLRETESSVTQVALQVGYSSASHFAQQFKRHASGQTPSAFRRVA